VVSATADPKANVGGTDVVVGNGDDVGAGVDPKANAGCDAVIGPGAGVVPGVDPNTNAGCDAVVGPGAGVVPGVDPKANTGCDAVVGPCAGVVSDVDPKAKAGCDAVVGPGAGVVSDVDPNTNAGCGAAVVGAASGFGVTSVSDVPNEILDRGAGVGSAANGAIAVGIVGPKATFLAARPWVSFASGTGRFRFRLSQMRASRA
jgi:hypothetical protein